MSDDELKRVQAIADALLDSYQNGVNEGLEFGKTERERLREENARLRRLVKTVYAEGCYDSTKTEKTQEEFEALWKESFAYNVILEGGKVKAEAACPAPDEAP